jgi:hypothetical protein
MDDIVKAAMKKWPNVPHCHGWLGLDVRGDWYLRDAATQAAGPFPHSKGSRVTHDKLREFIGRNYEADASGAWYFQNGPQRVFVDLEAAPLVLSVRREGAAAWRLEDHTGRTVDRVLGCWLDEQGRLYLATPRGLAVVRSMDMDAAADALSEGVWPEPTEATLAELAQRFGHVLSPRPSMPDAGAAGAV